ncbi:MAG: carbohydrate ABC transporter permease [Eubacteriales bacterium]|nr:carbohydrate ABC transporter permease [Eubacteriales bacterium]
MMVRKRSLFSKIAEVFLVVLTIFTHWIVFYFAIITSGKNKAEAGRLDLRLPTEWNFVENYTYVLTYQNGAFLRALKNSVILTVFSILILVLTASATAYILQRRTGLIGKISNKIIIAGLIVPASIVPTYWMLKLLHIAGTLPGLVLVEVATLFPFATMLYKGYIASIPKEIDEAAIIDGCSAEALFARIIFPMIKPITATVVILRSIVVYNDFQNPQYYMSGSRSQTVQLFVYSMKSAWTTDYGHMFAAAILVSMPMILLYLFLNQKILEGMTAGAVKG